MGYKIEPIDEEKDKLSSIRVSKVLDYLTNEKPTLIPFKMKFPIVKDIDYKSFSMVVMNYSMYEDLPKFIKDKIESAEKVKYFDLKFKSYLSDKGLDESSFISKNPKTKLDILYDWMFENKLDIGILN